MKKIILFIFILGCCSLHAQYRSENVFYYYQGEKIFLTERKDKIFIKLDRDVDKKNLLVSIRADKVVRLSTDLKQDETLHDFTVLESKTDNDIPVSVLKQYRTNPGIISAQPLMQYKKTLQGLTDEFVVKLKGNISYTQFQKLVSDNRCIIVEENRFVKNQFLLSVVKESALNALQLANLFYETGLFEFSEPNFVILNAFNSNDTYFSSQWGLKNTGQNGGTSGVDIKAEQAWAIAQGNSNIKVAVIDDGVDLTHPDLQANLLPGYDFSNNNSGGAPVGTTDNHGTACAGIIGAIKDNGKGISGVAPNCKIIPIRFIGGSGLSTDVMANAIHWARQNGADVISNSWGGGSPYSPLENAIFNATTQGRNGKGCVVVFSSGNGNEATVSYPARLPNVIAVGAVDRCGVRSGRIDIVPNSCDPWCPSCEPGSSYGSDLDVVAPGTNVYTTDRQGSAGYNMAIGTNGDYDSGFGGTSAACPQVAGVAALILSVRPDLTQAQVRQAIESTCTKLSGYSFSNNSSHPNGTWNTQVGHGLVNAYAAVRYVSLISGPSTISGSAVFSVSNPPSGYTWTCSSNLTAGAASGNSKTFTVKSNNTSCSAWVAIKVGSTEVARKNLTITSLTSIGGPGTTGTGISTYYSPVTYNPGSTYQWLVYPSSGVSTSYGSQGSCILYFSQPGSYTVVCREVTACSTGEYILKDIQVGSSYAMSYRIASSLSGQIVIMPEAGRNDLLGATKMLTYRLSNMITGVSVATGRMPASGATLDFGHLPAGIYVLRIETGVDTFDTHKVVLK